LSTFRFIQSGNLIYFSDLPAAVGWRSASVKTFCYILACRSGYEDKGMKFVDPAGKF